MRFIAVAILLLTAGVAFAGAVLLTSHHGKKTVTVTVAQPDHVQPSARFLAATEGIEPLRAQERIRIARDTCDVLELVDAKTLATICTFNIEHGDPWYDGMPPRQLHAVADALIAASR